jgi:hypothetical protein
MTSYDYIVVGATLVEDAAPEVRDRVAERRVSSALPTPTISRGAVR